MLFLWRAWYVVQFFTSSTKSYALPEIRMMLLWGSFINIRITNKDILLAFHPKFCCSDFRCSKLFKNRTKWFGFRMIWNPNDFVWISEGQKSSEIEGPKSSVFGVRWNLNIWILALCCIEHSQMTWCKYGVHKAQCMKLWVKQSF